MVTEKGIETDFAKDFETVKQMHWVKVKDLHY